MELAITPGIGAITAAIIAAFVGFMSLVIAKEHKVSEFCQAWIDGLRNDLAEAISAASTLTVILQRPDPTPEPMLREWARFAASLARIELRLNLNERPHVDLQSCIREAQILLKKMEAHSDSYDQEEWETLQDRAVLVSQSLLKIEWETVKAGEPFYQGVKVTLLIVLIFAALSGVIAIAWDVAGNLLNTVPAANEVPTVVITG